MAQITLMGQATQTNGEPPTVGSSAPPFSLTDGKLQDKSLADFPGTLTLLSVVPSLDTMVCAKSTEKFEQLADDYPDCNFIVVSADLPFAQQRFSKEKKLSKVNLLSMMRNKNFAKDYGVLIQDGAMAGLTARAIFVIDAKQRIVYSQLVAEIGDEPDYDSALKALKN